MSKDRPLERLMSATRLLTCFISEADSIFGVGHSLAVVVDSTHGSVVLLEIDEALREIGCGNRKEEEREDSETLDSTGSFHGLGIGGVVESSEGAAPRSTRLL